MTTPKIPLDPQFEQIEAYVAEMQKLGTEPSRAEWERVWAKWVNSGVNTEGLALIGLKHGWIDTG